MKASELFPGAVVVYGKGLFVATFSSKRWIRLGKLKVRPDDPLLQPLPISPAVLRGLGFEAGSVFYRKGISVHKYFDDTYSIFDETDVTHAHQLQSLALHLYGVELVWNQSEYETALKEEAK